MNFSLYSDIIFLRKNDYQNLKQTFTEFKKSFNIPDETDESSLKIYLLDKDISCPYKICGGKGNVDKTKNRHFK